MVLKIKSTIFFCFFFLLFLKWFDCKQEAYMKEPIGGFAGNLRRDSKCASALWLIPQRRGNELQVYRLRQSWIMVFGQSRQAKAPGGPLDNSSHLSHNLTPTNNYDLRRALFRSPGKSLLKDRFFWGGVFERIITELLHLKNKNDMQMRDLHLFQRYGNQLSAARKIALIVWKWSTSLVLR